MTIEVANDHTGIVTVQGIWVINLELSIWWFVDRSDGDTVMLTVIISMSLFSVFV